VKILVLLSHAWRRHRIVLIALAGGLFLFEWLITRLAPEPSATGAIQQLLQLLPPALMQMFGNDIAANLNPRGMLSFGYAHPFAIVMMAAWAVRIPAGSLAGEVGTGRMDLIAARAVSRGAIVGGALLALTLGLAIIAAAGWVGTATGLAGRPALAVQASAFAGVAATQWLLFTAFGCLGLLVSATRRAGGAAVGLTSAILAVSFAVDYVARAWAPIAWMRRGSLFMYFHPLETATTGLAVKDVATIGGVAILAALGAFVVFARRDL
jgi:ABC-type transport system involved in multi-copper enzyme maturation permease subunit